MEKPTAKELKVIERLDDAWTLFLMVLGGHFQAEPEHWRFFMAGIRDIRRLERELIGDTPANQESLQELLARYEAEYNAELQAFLEREVQEREYAETIGRIQEQKYAERQRAKAIPCSRCGVAAGKPCRTTSGRRAEGYIHLVRLKESGVR